MTKPFATGLSMLIAAAATATAAPATPQRPPAVPLIACDPYFSVWGSDQLTSGPTHHWTGKPQRLTSLVRIDGHPYRIMGMAPPAVPAARQIGLTVMPTRTTYEFEEQGVRLTLTFMTPLLPDDLSVMSRPITYVTWSARATQGTHDVAVYLDADAELAVNVPDQVVTSRQAAAGPLTTLRVGTVDQPILETRGDDLRIDYGYFYLATDSKSAAILPADAGRDAFAGGVALPATDAAMAAQKVPAKEAPVLATVLNLGSVTATPVSAHVMLGYDDVDSIRYFNTDLKGYWTKGGVSFPDLLQTAEKDYTTLNDRSEKFDAELVADLKTLGGDSYVQIGVLAYRQSLAAQKICADAHGLPLSFSKENNSNGCIGTVDVLYPASPLMMAFSPNLLKASLRPLMDYSSSPRWKHDSAPHDLGTYPQATGQVYGGGDSDSGMPVEETGNMLCMLATLSKIEGNADFARPYWPTLTRWANYLTNNGFDPGTQLTTDDFAGHIARNTNLSAKAIMGVASYAIMADMLGMKGEARQYTNVAHEGAKKWMQMGDDGDHYALVFGPKGKGTWSQKYNLVWDTILGLDVFPKEVREKEMAYYMTQMNKYGLPLDSRKTYTKLDWEIWTSTLAEKKEDAQKIFDACALYANETPDRVPLSDWYETTSARKSGFQARSVVGGVFLPFLKDAALWKKYASRDTTRLQGWAETDFSRPEMKAVIPAADTAAAMWKYTTAAPGEDWKSPSFDDSSWKTGRSGFGTNGTPGAHVGTQWTSDNIWLRRDITLPQGPFHDLRFWLHHDEDVEVYLNGVVALRLHGFTAEYITHSIDEEGRAALKPGKNTIAVHCHQTIAGQYVDVGLVDLVPHAVKK